MTEPFVSKSVGVLFISLFTPAVLFAGPKVSGAISNTDAMSHAISIAVNIRRVNAGSTRFTNKSITPEPGSLVVSAPMDATEALEARNGRASYITPKSNSDRSDNPVDTNTMIHSQTAAKKASNATLTTEVAAQSGVPEKGKESQGSPEAEDNVIIQNDDRNVKTTTSTLTDISVSSGSDIFENRIDGGTGIDFIWQVTSTLSDSTFNEAIDITTYKNLTGSDYITNMASSHEVRNIEHGAIVGNKTHGDWHSSSIAVKRDETLTNINLKRMMFSDSSIFNESIDDIIFDEDTGYGLEDSHGAFNPPDTQMLNSITRNSENQSGIYFSGGTTNTIDAAE